MRISDWSSDVCSSDLDPAAPSHRGEEAADDLFQAAAGLGRGRLAGVDHAGSAEGADGFVAGQNHRRAENLRIAHGHHQVCRLRSEEHTSELQSLMRISYAVF